MRPGLLDLGLVRVLKIQRLILKGPYDGHPRFLPFLSPGWGDAVKGGDEGGSVVG